MFRRRPAPQSPDHVRLARREAERQLVAALGSLHGDLEEFYTFVPLPDGHREELKVVRPKRNSGMNGHTFIVLFHGAGFSNGSVDYMTHPARDFALKFNAVVVSATYRLAPEYPFPTPGFVVGGVSWSGPWQLAVLTQLAQDRGLTPPLTGAFVSIPLLLVKEIVPAKYQKEWTSMEDNKNNPSLNRDTVQNVIRILAPDIRSPLFSPFNSRTPHAGLPRTYIHVGGLDVLRDDGLVYKMALGENGVSTRCDVFPDLGHAAWTIFATGFSRTRLGPKMIEAMRWLLSQEESREQQQARSNVG